MLILPIMSLKPVVRYCEFPFGMQGDPSMREFIADHPREYQMEILRYLRSGLIFAFPMGGNTRDIFDRSTYAITIIDGKPEVCAVELTDGEWFWYAGLIYYVEKYNVKLPDEFIERAKRHGWMVDRSAIPQANFEPDYCNALHK